MRPALETLALRRNHKIFERILRLGQDASSRGDLELASAVAALAGHFAWNNHPGFAHSALLEDLVAHCGLPAASGDEHGDGEVAAEFRGVQHWGSGSVLHVATELGSIGGHTRLISRWIQLDAERRHTVLLTGGREARRRTRPVLDILGFDHVTQLEGDLLQRAAQLRKAASEHEVIVLHTHPFDVVPLLAFAKDTNRPPVLHLNHSDHVFWVGTRLADRVASVRPAGARFAEFARGIPTERNVVLPVPILPPNVTHKDLELLSRIGIRPGAIVIVTAASAYKFGRGGRPFLSVVDELLKRVPDCAIVVVGPSSKRRWRRQSRKHVGRLAVLGVVENLGALFRSADIYLESFPTASLTSLLEAVAHGLPAMSLTSEGDPIGLLLAGDPRLDGRTHECRTVSELVRVTTRLSVDSQLRESSGALAAAGVVSDDSVRSWVAEVGAIIKGVSDARGMVRTLHPQGGITLNHEVEETYRYVLRRHPGSDLAASFFEHHSTEFEPHVVKSLISSRHWYQLLRRARIPVHVRSILFLGHLKFSIAGHARRSG